VYYQLDSLVELLTEETGYNPSYLPPRDFEIRMEAQRVREEFGARKGHGTS